MSSQVIDGGPFRSGDRVFVVVNLAQLRRPNVHGLAQALHITEDAVFESLVGLPQNERAVEDLYEQMRLRVKQYGDDQPTSQSFDQIGIRDARRKLMAWKETLRSTLAFAGHGRSIETLDLIGTLPVPQEGRFVFPLYEGIYCAELHQPDVRESRFFGTYFECVKRPDALEQHCRILAESTRDLAETTKRRREHVEAAAKDLAGLTMARRVVDAMMSQRRYRGPPRNIARQSNDGNRKALLALGNAVDELERIARAALIEEPVVHNTKNIEAEWARAVLDRLANEEFVELVRYMLERPADFGELYKRHLDTIEAAYKALLESNVCIRVIEDHVLPLIDVLASREVEEFPTLAPSGHQATPSGAEFWEVFLDSAGTRSELKESKSIMSVLALIAKAIKEFVGDGEGPASLCAAVLEIAGPMIMTRVSNDARQSGRYAGRLFRCVMWFAHPTLEVRQQAIDAIVRGSVGPEDVRRMKGRWLGSRGKAFWLLVSVIIGLAAIHNLRNDSDLKDYLKAFGGCAGILLAGWKVVGPSWDRAVGRVVGDTARKAGKRLLGCVGALLATVNGAMLARESSLEGDSEGVAYGLAEAAGGVIGLIGFSIWLGAASSAAVAVGSGLMLIGAAIGIVLIGLDLYKLWQVHRLSKSGPVFDRYIESFRESQAVKDYLRSYEVFYERFGMDRDDEDRERMAKVRHDFDQALTAVREAFGKVQFWQLHDAARQDLKEREFSDGDIAALTAW